MDQLNPAAEYLRIAEHYRQMKDEELLALVPQNDKLTPFAQQALASEVRQRGLKVEAKDEKSAGPQRPSQFTSPSAKFRDASKEDLPGADIQSADLQTGNSATEDEAAEQDRYEEDPYEEDRKLFTMCTVWSLRDALKVQRVLDVAGIPFFMGPEKATGVDKVMSDFAKGVEVQIMQVGWPWAYQAMKDNYLPEDDPPSEKPKDPTDLKDLVVRCPRCPSTAVVFDGLSAAAGVPGDKSSQKFRWTCDACGNQWEDEGVGREE